tara:strand:+ start:187 stop:414 length:228 start_codon:yes stop_codon:yes gene_type:complete
LAKNQNNNSRNQLELCISKNKDINNEIICQQDFLHKQALDNPLEFIIFYVFTVIFIAFLFQFSRKGKDKRKLPKQ